MEIEQLKKIVETLLYMTDHPLTIKEVQGIIELKSVKDGDIRHAVKEIKQGLDDAGSGLCVMEVAGGMQMATRPEMATYIRKMYKERLTTRLSASALETLSIIAYKQPIARSEIEQIRGVEATGVMDTLLERRMVKVVGRKETIGRPLLYGTTPEFLRQFGLNHLSDLPDLETLPVKESITAEETPEEEVLPQEDVPEVPEEDLFTPPSEEAESGSEEAPAQEETGKEEGIVEPESSVEEPSAIESVPSTAEEESKLPEAESPISTEEVNESDASDASLVEEEVKKTEEELAPDPVS